MGVGDESPEVVHIFYKEDFSVFGEDAVHVFEYVFKVLYVAEHADAEDDFYVFYVGVDSAELVFVYDCVDVFYFSVFHSFFEEFDVFLADVCCKDDSAVSDCVCDVFCEGSYSCAIFKDFFSFEVGKEGEEFFSDLF